MTLRNASLPEDLQGLSSLGCCDYDREQLLGVGQGPPARYGLGGRHSSRLPVTQVPACPGFPGLAWVPGDCSAWVLGAVPPSGRWFRQRLLRAQRGGMRCVWQCGEGPAVPKLSAELVSSMCAHFCTPAGLSSRDMLAPGVGRIRGSLQPERAGSSG